MLDKLDIFPFLGKKRYFHIAVRQEEVCQYLKVTWSDESSFTELSTSGRVLMWWTPREQYSPEKFNPDSEGSWWLWYGVGGIFLARFWSTCPLSRKRHCNLILLLIKEETFLRPHWMDWLVKMIFCGLH